MTSRERVDVKTEKIDALLATFDRCHLPGIAVGLAIDGIPAYRKGYGLASMELPVVLSPTIRMRIGSTSKHFTSLAYLLLCEEGRATLNDRVGTYLPELHPVTHQITARHLMAHTSGLRDATNFNYQFSGTQHAASSAELLSLYRDIDDVNAAPDTNWIYNNGGYLILSAMIERIADQPLEEVLRQRIFEPVGLIDTELRRFDTDFVANSATLHTTNPAGHYEKSYLGSALAGEGGMVSTIDDMLRWLRHMETPVVGAAATWGALKTPQQLINGTSTGYGLGLVTGRYRGVDTLYHSGSVMGGNSQMLRVPAAGLDLAVMTNRHDVNAVELAQLILDTCLVNLRPARSSWPVVVGNYFSPTTERVIQLLEQGGRQVVSVDSMSMPVEADDEGVLWPIGASGTWRQATTLVGPAEKPDSIRFSDFGNLDVLQPLPPGRESDATAIDGLFWSAASDTTVTIGRAAHGAGLSARGRWGSVSYQLECLADGVWKAKAPGAIPWSGMLVFDPDKAAFRFSNNACTRRLTFRRQA